MMHHHCHARGCDKSVRPTLLMCGRHWRLVPPALKVAVLRAYRPGQCDDKRPSTAWKEAAFAAIDAVAKLEGLPARVRMDVRKTMGESE